MTQLAREGFLHPERLGRRLYYSVNCAYTGLATANKRGACNARAPGRTKRVYAPALLWAAFCFWAGFLDFAVSFALSS